LLAVDTAGETGNVLLARLEAGAIEVLGEQFLEPRKFSTQMISSIAELLDANRLQLSDLDALAAISGPGSFTGLRVGLSALKAMAEATGKPVIAVSRLATMASAAGLPAGQTVHAVLDAGRGEFYHGIYRDAGRTCIAESLASAGELLESVAGVPGPVVAWEPTVLSALRVAIPSPSPVEIPPVTARGALPLILAAWETGDFSDVAALDANYLRRVHAEPAAGTPILT